jgi:hypothetical protein
MLPSEKLAIAARLHVILRRKTGRVTDTEWLAVNAEYAAEIVRFSRERAVEPGMEDVAEWADRLELAMTGGPAPRKTLLGAVAQARVTVAAPPREPQREADPRTSAGDSVFADSRPAPPRDPPEGDTGRYVGGLR